MHSFFPSTLGIQKEQTVVGCDSGGRCFGNGRILGNEIFLPFSLGHFTEIGPDSTIRLGLGAYSRVLLEHLMECDVVGQMERAEDAVDLCGLLRRGVDLHFHGICTDSLSDHFPHRAHLPGKDYQYYNETNWKSQMESKLALYNFRKFV